MDLSKILVFFTSNWDGKKDFLEASFKDRIQIEHQMTMDMDLRNKILDREIQKHCPHLIVPLPVRHELLKIASIRLMTETLIVSCDRSMRDNLPVLCIYPLI